jgi:2-oxoglutarate ferredoxin oxidoreductase subunit delta
LTYAYKKAVKKGGLAMAAKVRSEKCKGCYFCIKVCPQKAITVPGAMNDNGYEFVEVNEESCTSCGLCFMICPDHAIEIS